MEEQTRTREQTAVQTASETATKSREASGGCPHCGATLDGEYELCPVCGGKLVDYCTFCGAPMRPDDVDCPECGMPSEGVVCPACNIRNYRSFCRQCGQPLSRAAQKAVEKAKQDPKVQEAVRLMTKIAELEAEMDGALPGGGGEETPSGPSEKELRVREMMAKMGFEITAQPRATQRRVGRSREEVLKEYEQAVDDANSVLESMLPPAGSTPQEQRNFFTARKVAVMEMTTVLDRVGWICNWCHCYHSQPSECYRPWMGGTWQYEKVQKEVKTYKRV